MQRGPFSLGLLVGHGPFALASLIFSRNSSFVSHFYVSAGRINKHEINVRNKIAIGYIPAAIIGTPTTHGIIRNPNGMWKNGIKKNDMKIFIQTISSEPAVYQ